MGTSKLQGVNVRFIAATNIGLEVLQDQKIFRQDLFYRLCGAWLHLPPLRERMEDLGVLVERFLKNYSKYSTNDIEEPVWTILKSYDYPGNIRELKSIVQHAVNLAEGKSISVYHLPTYLTDSVSAKALPARRSSDVSIIPLAAMEKEHILRVYQSTCENKLRSARLLEVSVNTLRRKLQSYDID